MEFDMEKEVWEEECGCFANPVTNHTLCSQVAGNVLEGREIYSRQQLGEDIIGLRELEGKAWEGGGGKDSEGGDNWDIGGADDDGGCVAKLGGGEWR